MINLSNKIGHTCGQPLKWGEGAIVTFLLLQHVLVLGVMCCVELNTPICMVNPWEGDPRRYESVMNLTVYIFSPRI